MTNNKSMTYEQAVKVAIESMLADRRGYAVNANIHKKLGDNQPAFINAYKKVSDIDAAIDVLKGNPVLWGGQK